MQQFPQGTTFFNVKGVPVSLSPGMGCAAWDDEEARPFDADAAREDGVPITAEVFLDLVLRGASATGRPAVVRCARHRRARDQRHATGRC
jgi:hypothetical protein